MTLSIMTPGISIKCHHADCHYAVSCFIHCHDQCHYVEGRFAECCYAECRGAHVIYTHLSSKKINSWNISKFYLEDNTLFPS